MTTTTQTPGPEETTMTRDEIPSALTEWVAVLDSANADGVPVRVRIAYRSPAALARGLQEQTSAGWVAVSVYERERATYRESE